MRALLLALAVAGAVAGAGCKKREREASPQVAPMAPAEVQRSEDACQGYVARACACATTVPAATRLCQEARALPEAIRIALETAASPDSKPDVVRQTHASVRKTVKECIEQTARLPAIGCP